MRNIAISGKLCTARTNLPRSCFLAVLMIVSLGACANQTPVITGTVSNQASQPLPQATDLAFREFYKLPVGPKGLEPTDKLLRLNNQYVRLQGYVVKEEEPLPGLFMMAPMPVAMAELADGPADYLPPATLFVHFQADNANKFLPHQPGIWTVVGRLELGGKEEPSGRRSYVRLLVDGPTSLRDPGNRIPELTAQLPKHHHEGH